MGSLDLLGVAAVIAATFTGTTGLIVALNARRFEAALVPALEQSAVTQKQIHTAVNSNYSRLQNLLLAAVAIIVGLIAYVVLQLRNAVKSPPATVG